MSHYFIEHMCLCSKAPSANQLVSNFVKIMPVLVPVALASLTWLCVYEVEFRWSVDFRGGINFCELAPDKNCRARILRQEQTLNYSQGLRASFLSCINHLRWTRRAAVSKRKTLISQFQAQRRSFSISSVFCRGTNFDVAEALILHSSSVVLSWHVQKVKVFAAFEIASL